MATITIQRAGSRLPTSGGASKAPLFAQADTGITEGLGAIGDRLEEQVAKEKVANDTVYVASSAVLAQKQAYNIQEEAKAEFADDPSKYSQHVVARSQEVYQSILDNAPSSEAKNTLVGRLAGYAQADFANTMAWQKTQTVAKYIDTYTESINSIANEMARDPSKAPALRLQQADLLESASTFRDPKKVEELRDIGVKALAKAEILGTISQNPFAGDRLIASGAYDKIFTADEMEGMRDQSKLKKNSMESELKKQKKIESDKIEDDFRLRIYNAETEDNIGLIQTKLDNELAEDRISVDQYIKMDKEAETALEDIVKTEESTTKLNMSDAFGTPLDPDNTSDLEIVDRDYKNTLLPVLADMQPEEAAAKTLSYVTRRGIIPTSLKNNLQSHLDSTNPAAKVSAADMITQITNQSPRLTKQFNVDQAALASKISYYKSTGMSSDESIKAAEIEVFEKGTAQHTQRVTHFKEVRKDMDTHEVSDTFFVPDVEDLPSGLVSDWETLYRSFVVDKQMPEELARTEAYKRVNATWGTTKIEGADRIMKNSPETVYGIDGVDNEWMYQDLAKTIDDVRIFPDDQRDEEVFRNLKIVVDPRTETSTKPAYQIYYNDPQDGLLKAVPKSAESNSPLVWRPSWTSSTAYGELEKQKTEDMRERKDRVADINERRKRTVDKAARADFLGVTMKELSSLSMDDVNAAIKEDNRDKLELYLDQSVSNRMSQGYLIKPLREALGEVSQ